MMKKEQKFSRSPSRLIIIYILITFFVLSIGIRYYFKQKEEIRNDAYSDLSVISEMKANQISNWRSERISDANVIFNSKFLISDLKKLFDHPNDVILKGTIISHFSAYYNFNNYKDIIIFDTNAVIKYSLDTNLSKLSKISFSVLKNAKKDNKPVFSEIYLCELCNDIHLDIVIPLIEKDVLFGGIILRIDPSEFLFPLLQTWPTKSKSSETLLITKEGDEVVYLNELRHQKSTALKLKFKIDSSNVNIPAVQAVMGKTGLMRGNDYRGIPVLSNIRKISDSQWYMISKVDLDEIYAPVKEKAINMGILTGLILLSFAIGFVWVWTNQRKSIQIQHLEEEKKHQALIKHFDYIVKYANDIFILTDTDLNIMEVNDRAVQVYGYTREEMLKLNIKDLRAPETLPQLNEQLKNFNVAGEAFYETLHKRKDLSTFPVEASVRTVDIDGTVFYQAIIKDISERKKAEEAVRESEIKFRSLFENAILGIYRTTPDGQIIDCNPALLKLLGFNSLEDLAKRNLELIGFEPGYSRSEFRKKIETEGEIKGLESAWIKKDGTTIFVHENAKAIKDKDGKFLFYEGTVEDITERKKMEESIIELSSRNEAILSSVPDIIMEVDNNKVYTWANKAGIEFFGDDVIGKEAAYYFEGEQKTYEIVNPLFKGDENVFYVESRQRRKDGEKRLLAWWCRVLKDAEGNVIGALSSAQDITERKQAEEVLIMQKRIGDVFLTNPDDEMFNEVLNILLEVMESPFGVFGYIDEDGALVVPTMTRQIWDKCDVPEKSIIFPRDTWGDSSWPRAVREKKANYSNKISNKTPEGHVTLTRHISLPIIFQEEVVGLFQVANKETDYTEADINLLGTIARYVAPVMNAKLLRQRSEDEIKKLNEELEQRVIERTAQLEQTNKELEAFSYSVSHDLRAPLRSIDGFSHALFEDYYENLDDKAKDYLSRIRNSTARMDELIDSMLKLSRVTRFEIRYRKLDLSSVANEILDNLKITDSKRVANFIIQKDVIVEGDAYLLRILLENLINNAWKFTSKNDKAVIELGTLIKDSNIIYFIKDNGTGFDMKYYDKLFGAFQRLHSKKEFPGTGIGLATAQRIVHRHNGKIWAESEIGKGTTFFFTLK